MADWITDSQDEQSYEDLFRDSDQVHIPIFQRSYIWKKKEFEHLISDIEQIQENIERTQFLGAIVAYERPRPHGIVGRLRELDIVDGQQRLLTLYMFVMAIVEVSAPYDREYANETVREFLLLQHRRGLEINTRIVPAFDDRSQFRILWDRLNTPEVLQEQFRTNTPHPPSPSGTATGNMIEQYNRILRYIKDKCPREQEERVGYLQRLQEIITRNLSFVHLKLTDASVAMKIFERLNFRGVRVGIEDLVRNEVFSRCEDQPTEASNVFHNDWRPFIDGFNDEASEFFFPYCLIHNSNITKSELFAGLRRTWGSLSPIEIINHMKPYQKPYMAISQGVNNYEPDDVRINIERLYRINSPSSIYPFIMSILHNFECRQLSEDLCKKFLYFTEAFLVRRAIQGFEPTGLHSLYKGLWATINPSPSLQKYIDEIDSRSTIHRPTNEEVKEAIKKRPLAKSKICKYLLIEYDKSLPGDNPTGSASIEHVLPDTYTTRGEWNELFTEREHKDLKDTLANILPLSNPLNSSIQQSSYENKRQRYLMESMFKTPRKVANTYTEWTLESINNRAEEIASWTVERWPFHIQENEL